MGPPSEVLLLPLLLTLATGFDFTPADDDSVAQFKAELVELPAYRPTLPPPPEATDYTESLTGPSQEAFAAWRADPDDLEKLEAARERVGNVLNVGNSDVWLAWAEIEYHWAPVAWERMAARLAKEKVIAPVPCDELRGSLVKACESYMEARDDKGEIKSFASKVEKQLKNSDAPIRFAHAHLQHALGKPDAQLYADVMPPRGDKMVDWTKLQYAQAMGPETLLILDIEGWGETQHLVAMQLKGESGPDYLPLYNALAEAEKRASGPEDRTRVLLHSVRFAEETGSRQHEFGAWETLSTAEAEDDAVAYANVWLAIHDDRRPPVSRLTRAVHLARGDLGRITRLSLGWMVLADFRLRDAESLANKAGDSEETDLLLLWTRAMGGDIEAIHELHGEPPEEPLQQIGWAADVCTTRAKVRDRDLALRDRISTVLDDVQTLTRQDSEGVVVLYECLDELMPGRAEVPVEGAVEIDEDYTLEIHIRP